MNRIHELEHLNQLNLARLEESESIEEYLKKEIKQLEEIVRQVYAEVSIKCNKIEMHQDKVLRYKYENDLIEAALENRNKKLRPLKEKCNKNKDKVKRRSNHQRRH